jgi:hypothetical protein
MSSSFFPVVGYPEIPDGIPDIDDDFDDKDGIVEEEDEDGFVVVFTEDGEYEFVSYLPPKQ